MAKQKSKFLSGKRINLTPVSVNAKLLVLLMIFSSSLIVSGCKTFSRAFNNSGTVFTVEIQTDEPNRNEIIERAVKVTQSRLDAVGAGGEVTRIAGKDNQISVKIYETENLEPLKKFLFTTYQLELKKIVSPLNPAPLQTYPTKESAELAATGEQEVLPYQDEDDPRHPFIIVEKQAIVTGEDVRDAQAISMTNLKDDYAIAFTLKPEGAKKFGDWTGKNIGSYLAIVLDKKVQSAPYIKSQIFDQGQIDGRFTKQTAEDTALALKSGYLPATMKIIEEKSFGN